MLTVEIASAAGFVGLLITDDDNGNHTEIVMSPDEARQFSNNIGSAIMAAAASRAGALT
jgi:hypothetical protein